MRLYRRRGCQIYRLFSESCVYCGWIFLTVERMPLTEFGLRELVAAARARWPGSAWYELSLEERLTAVIQELDRIERSHAADRDPVNHLLN
jgi:hypothetical protein